MVSGQWSVATHRPPQTDRQRLRNTSRHRIFLLVFWYSLSTVHCPLSTVLGAQWPSLFRGVVVADSPLGVRVVSVEEASQAYWADLRPEDIIVRVDHTELHSIDEFAKCSTALKGRAVSAAVLIFRNGAPRELRVHLYSYPVLQAWGLEFLPDHDVRFAQPETGREYWTRLARGFETSGNDTEALSAYLNALHNVPTDVDSAVHVATLLSRAGQQRLQAGALAEAFAILQRATLVMERLFEFPLSEEQLTRIKAQLQGTLQAIQRAAAPARSLLAIQTFV